jgi:hypothetical protein
MEQWAHTVRWQYVLYAIMNFILSYGFFTIQRWLVPLLALNFLGGVFQIAIKMYVHTPTKESLISYGLSVCLSALVLFVTYYTKRKDAKRTWKTDSVGVLFLVSWLSVACYAVLNAAI